MYADAGSVKTYLGITSSTDDAFLTTLCGRAQKLIETFSLRVFEGAATTRYFDAVADLYDDGGLSTLLLLDKDLASVVSVTNGDGVLISASDYVTEPRNEGPYWGIRLKRGASVSWAYTDYPENAIAINGVWAYSVVAPVDVVQATIDLVVYMYRRRGADTTMDRPQISPSGVMIYPPGYPETVKAVIETYRPRGGGK